MCKKIDSDNAAECGGSRGLILDHSCLAGLHPDGYTEDRLHVALRSEKSIDIVLSCVFITRICPMRQLRSTVNLFEVIKNSCNIYQRKTNRSTGLRGQKSCDLFQTKIA